MLEVAIADNPVEIIKLTFDKLHQWKPDILAIEYQLRYTVYT